MTSYRGTFWYRTSLERACYSRYRIDLKDVAPNKDSVFTVPLRGTSEFPPGFMFVVTFRPTLERSSESFPLFLEELSKIS